ncbi:MAG: IS21 family transposase [candidate division KSB1 bacterium]|nr:IS21 family transposase [candidate division KSB1 bacterium]
MMNKRIIFEIHKLADMGMKQRQIARKLCISRPTVQKYLNSPDIATPPRRPKPGKLEPFYNYIDELLEGWPNASAVVIKQRIDEKGYTGGITILRDYLLAKRGGKKRSKAYIRFESSPGEQCQFDWGHFGSLIYGNTSRKLYCMTVIECHSRMLYIEFTHSQNKEAVMRTLLNSFLFFGGAPKELVHDNLKTAVIERIGDIIRFNEDYLHFLRPFHIRPYACGIRDASAKGKIEKGGVHYVRYNFWPCRTFADLDDVNVQACKWRDHIANTRIHATTNEKPVERFQPKALRPLPDVLPDTRDHSEAKVHSDCRFKFDANYYSAPWWMAGKTVSVKADNHTIWAGHKNKIVAVHTRSWKRRAVIENPNHISELLKTRKKARLTRQEQLLFSMGEPIKLFIENLAKAGKSLSRASSHLLELREQYGAKAVVEAVEITLKYKAYGVDYVENILHQKMHIKTYYPKVTLKDETLNQLQLQEPDLLIYDAITLKKSRNNDDKN